MAPPAAMAMFLPRRCMVRIVISVINVGRTGGSVVPSAVGGAVDVVFCGGGLNLGIGGSVRPKPAGGVGGGGKRLRGAAASAGGTGVKKGLAAPFALSATAPTGGGVGVPGSGTTGIAGEADDDARAEGGGPSGAREGGGGNTPPAPGRAKGAGAPV